MPRALALSLQGALDLLHEGPVLKDVEGLLLALPVLGADDNEVLSSAPPDPQRDMSLHHFLDRLPQVTAELVNRYLSHDPKCTRVRYERLGQSLYRSP